MNKNKYTKKVFSDLFDSAEAEIYRNGRLRTDWKRFNCFFGGSIAKKEKNLINANKWADDMIAVLQENETNEP